MREKSKPFVVEATQREKEAEDTSPHPLFKGMKSRFRESRIDLTLLRYNFKALNGQRSLFSSSCPQVLERLGTLKGLEAIEGN